MLLRSFFSTKRCKTQC